MPSTPRIDELRQKFHENPRRYFAALANEYRKAGDPEQAIAICRAHLAQQPAHMSGHVVYAQALHDAGRTDEARTVFEQALALDPENVIALRHLGDIARSAGDSDAARNWYARALECDPQDSEIAAYLAELGEPAISGEIEPASVPDASAAEPEEPEVAEPAAPEAAPAEADYSEPVTEPAPGPEPVTAGVPEGSDASDAEPGWPVAEPALDDQAAPASEQEPVSERRSPFITRTMAELYAEQGYRSAALEVYRALALVDPGDADIQARIAELSAMTTPGYPQRGVVPEGGQPAPDAESPAAEREALFEPVESELAEASDGLAIEEALDKEISTVLQEANAAREASGADAGLVAYAPPVPAEEKLDVVSGAESETGSAGEAASGAVHSGDLGAAQEPVPVLPESVGLPPEMEAEAPAASDADLPGDTAAPPAQRERTIAEFFAILAAQRPAERESEQPAPVPQPDALSSLFEGRPVKAEDVRAASALSGALASSPPGSGTASPARRPEPSPARERQTGAPTAPVPDESEEDIRRFREWLDGLTES